MDEKSPSDLISRSSAVVQYSSVKFPVQFSTIRLNTDLKQPPTTEASNDRHENVQQYSPFHSLNMAATYDDLLGNVDVISSSKNIKQLLKSPFSPSPRLSIIVHRLRKTILLEEFDVNKNLLRNESKEWSWLLDFCKNIIAKEEKIEEDRMKCLVSAAKRDSSTENMYINLIRHSFAAASIEDVPYTMMETGDHTRKVNSLPEPSEADLRGFHHESLWKFEDISMLIDSDLPIFGMGSTKRPCISLRLRDARSPPINVLTGLDYWLDNLMSNVPEVAMCYHIDGFVQKYEVIRTEDIPELTNSKFDSQVVTNIARNIMAFIKANAVVEGHTYWLYKSENDDMVKLYNLTDHCKNEISKDDNPFTVPVGLLCYRMGYKLKSSNQKRHADSRAMFESCLRLLDDSKHSQICANAHFHLSDMWVPNRSVNDIWSDKGKLSEPPSDLYDEDENSSDEGLNSGLEPSAIEHKGLGLKALEDGSPTSESSAQNGSEREGRELAEKVNGKAAGTDKGKKDSEHVRRERASPKRSKKNEEEIKNEVALRELVVRGMIKRRAWHIVQSCRIAGETDERCKMALGHIRKGLNCVDKDQARGKNIGLVEPQQTCSPSKAIPLHYSPLNPNLRSRDSSVDRVEAEDLSATSSAPTDEYQHMCTPGKAIPLHFTPLKGHTNAQKGVEKDGSEPNSEQSENSSQSEIFTVQETRTTSTTDAIQHYMLAGFDPTDQTGNETSTEEESSSGESWHVHAKFVLLRKAAITYFVLAKSFYEIHKFGHTLRHLRYAMHCYECLEVLRPNIEQDDGSVRELYFLMMYLAAKTRLSLHNINWPACHKEFEELGEEEAAILSSAQNIVTTPKRMWMYVWSPNLESNYETARDLFLHCLASPELENRPTDFKAEARQNLALSWFNLANVSHEICRERIKTRRDRFENIRPLWDKALQLFLETVKAFELTSDKNTIGHVYNNIANHYILAGSGMAPMVFSVEDPIPKKEKEFYNKAVEYFEKSLNTLERQETMDPTREAIYCTLRNLYQQLSNRIASLFPNLVTDNLLTEMKDLIHKSLSYCQLESTVQDLRDHQIYAALNHVNLARVHELETRKFKNPTRRRALHMKAEESLQTAFDLYSKLKWRRSQIFVKHLYIVGIFNNSDYANLSLPMKKKLYRTTMNQLCDLQSVIESLMVRDTDQCPDQSTGMYTSDLAAVKELISDLNGAFNGYLKLDKACSSVKEFYQRCLRLTCLNTEEEIYPPLNQLLFDVKKFLSSETT